MARLILLAFSLPSLSSVFPFLEGVCPADDPTWHIRRSRSLDNYDSVWARCKRSKLPEPLTLVSISGILQIDAQQLEIDDRHYYFLCLVPKEWGTEGICAQISRFCSPLFGVKSDGRVIDRREFDAVTHGQADPI